MTDTTTPTLESMTKPPIGIQSLKTANPNDSLFNQGIDYNDPTAVANQMEALSQGLEKHADSITSGHGAHSNPEFLLRKSADVGKRCAAFLKEFIAICSKPAAEKKEEGKK